ncbi:hypothetical protein H7B90_23630 [Cohnella xylanilytica]|uniref:Uncharacterized protein n=1 Tax=Cohnella xylanilytica TaxID=557555 RepID=A0A841U4C2_9BACL|nr:hypothetical protein [Cohnella xylanilytica]MBB6694392.1 hypothetical protein [Cohnella xylanilytica]
MERFEKVKFKHYCKNESSKVIAVGNAKDFIAAYDTIDEAAEAVSKINIGESKWGVISILSPGESKEIELERVLYPEEDSWEFESGN